jgi:Uma2 family endonuclease
MSSVKHDWTVADVHALPDDGNRYEVVDGELFVTPAPALRHQEAVIRLHSILAEYLRRQRVGHAFVSPADVIFSPRRGVQPDVFVTPLVGGRRPESFGDVKRLLLAAEVLSPSTARADRVDKRRLYRDEQVPAYWIVDLDARAVERSTPDEPRPEILVDRVDWLPEGASEPLIVDLPAYFRAVLDE